MARVVRISRCYLPPTRRLCENGINYAFAFAAEAGPHLTDLGGMEG